MKAIECFGVESYCLENTSVGGHEKAVDGLHIGYHRHWDRAQQYPIRRHFAIEFTDLTEGVGRAGGRPIGRHQPVGSCQTDKVKLCEVRLQSG